MFHFKYFSPESSFLSHLTLLETKPMVSAVTYYLWTSRGQVVRGHPVQRWEKVPVGRSDEPGPLLAVRRNLPGEQDRWGGVRQR